MLRETGHHLHVTPNGWIYSAPEGQRTQIYGPMGDNLWMCGVNSNTSAPPFSTEVQIECCNTIAIRVLCPVSSRSAMILVHILQPQIQVALPWQRIITIIIANLLKLHVRARYGSIQHTHHAIALRPFGRFVSGFSQPICLLKMFSV